jgi:hypothetical protein
MRYDLLFVAVVLLYVGIGGSVLARLLREGRGGWLRRLGTPSLSRRQLMLQAWEGPTAEPYMSIDLFDQEAQCPEVIPEWMLRETA